MINIAIIGAGIGREHLAALRKLPSKFRVVAVVDQNLERIEEIRDEDTFAAVSDIKKVLTATAFTRFSYARCAEFREACDL
jgi:predicted dehydrogenase